MPAPRAPALDGAAHQEALQDDGVVGDELRVLPDEHLPLGALPEVVRREVACRHVVRPPLRVVRRRLLPGRFEAGVSRVCSSIGPTLPQGYCERGCAAQPALYTRRCNRSRGEIGGSRSRPLLRVETATWRRASQRGAGASTQWVDKAQREDRGRTTQAATRLFASPMSCNRNESSFKSQPKSPEND